MQIIDLSNKKGRYLQIRVSTMKLEALYVG